MHDQQLIWDLFENYLDAAKARGEQVVVAAIKEETSPEIERHGATAVYWLSLGELSKLIETFQKEGVRRVIIRTAVVRDGLAVVQAGAGDGEPRHQGQQQSRQRHHQGGGKQQVQRAQRVFGARPQRGSGRRAVPRR